MARKIDVVFSDLEPGAALAKAVAMKPEEIIAIVKDSNLRGRGGAGFPTGLKWESARAQGRPACVVCNADEGEPGTFKDKRILELRASKVIEAMVICARAIGADKGYIYMRGEYSYLRKEIEATMSRLAGLGMIGKAVLGDPTFHFDLQLRLGSGAYVCGEETALIDSLESRRGEPRNKPPFPTEHGFLGMPTVVNNVETLALVPHIILNGAEWFRDFGTRTSSGSKLFSVSGDCRKPGIYEFEYGITIRELLKAVEAGPDTKAVQIGGASGYCASADDFDKSISFEGIPTGGSIIVFDQSRSMFKILKNFVEFFQEESCGQCTPCREGCSRMLEGILKFERGQGSSKVITDLLELAETMSLASKCGFGQSVPNSFRTIVSKFRDEILSA
ncbi:MAG TPA: NADH-ubiquinone oxidoreductase-F iron-sulfur binding region domain-containing protein [Rectinemataceae bacterium]|nr:NADH-ubiquinone oxidoreductase-F iron-sulfur binding region domain-containing protein [Rectinemataceae bacterium]